MPEITITSTAFAAGARIPTQHAYRGEGENVSPPLAWSGVPAAAKELVLIVDDPDAPRAEPWVHWVLYGLAPDVHELAEGASSAALPKGAREGKNDFGEIGWGGPMPPKGHGTHHYHFRLYALDAAIDLKPGLVAAAVSHAIERHVVARGELVGTYSR